MTRLHYAQDRANASWHLLINENRRIHDQAMAEFSQGLARRRRQRRLLLSLGLCNITFWLGLALGAAL